MTQAEPEALSRRLLDWYDRHARDLPWRAPPGAARRPDPYRVWLSEIMLQQTTTAHAAPYFRFFTETWPRVQDLAEAEDADVMSAWAGLGYYARARNLLKCAREVAARPDGAFPDTEAGLRALPGIGPYTAAAVAAIAFDRPAAVLDGNIERVLARLFAVETPLPAAKPELAALAARLTPETRPGDYAQAAMDLGATVCTPRSPACGVCPWMEACEGRRRGLAPELPRKAAKAPKPTRRGAVFVLLDPAGAVLLEQRPDKGLLGGTMGLPGTAWDRKGAETPPEAAEIAAAAPLAAQWRAAPTQARHVFTHFALTLDVLVARAPAGARPERGVFAPDAAAQAGTLPTVMKKALRIGLSALEGEKEG